MMVPDSVVEKVDKHKSQQRCKSWDVHYLGSLGGKLKVMHRPSMLSKENNRWGTLIG